MKAALPAILLVSTAASLSAMVPDSAYIDFPTACAAALSSGNPDKTLNVTKSWKNLPSQTCAANLTFASGTSLQPAQNASLVLSGNIEAPPVQVFDTSLTGASIGFVRAVPMPAVYPQWWGARGDRAHDDTLALQAALDSVRGEWTGYTFRGIAPVILPGGDYLITAQLRVYGAGHPGRQGYESYVLKGLSATQTSTITYRGPVSQSAIRWIGGFGELSGLSLVDGGSGWRSGISYDGDPTVSRSTKGVFDHLFIDCRGLPGDGIDIGATRYQADQLSLRDIYVNGCTSGAGVNVLDPNALAINLYNPSITFCWIAIRGAAPGVNIAVFGGEIDSNDVNFFPAPGDSLLVSSVRSENSKRTLYTAAGTYSQSFTLINYDLSSLNLERPPTTTTASAGASQITLSTPGFTMGDAILIQGAGKGGADLHSYITSMSSPVDTALAFNPVLTAVHDAAIVLDNTVQQNTLVENSRGPYVHINSHFNPPTGATTSISAASQVFIGNSWTQPLKSPFGAAPGNVSPSAVLLGNLTDTSRAINPMANTMGLVAATFKPLAASQDVSNANFFLTANQSDTVIETFTGGIYGQTVQVSIADNHTFFATTGNLRFPGASPMKASTPAIYEFVCSAEGGPWIMVLGPQNRPQ